MPYYQPQLQHHQMQDLNRDQPIPLQTMAKRDTIVTSGPLGTCLVEPEPKRTNQINQWNDWFEHCNIPTPFGRIRLVNTLVMILIGTIILNGLLIWWIVISLRLHQASSPLRSVFSHSGSYAIRMNGNLQIDKELRSNRIQGSAKQSSSPRPLIIESSDGQIQLGSSDRSSILLNNHGMMEMKTDHLRINQDDGVHRTTLQIHDRMLILDDSNGQQHLRSSNGGYRIGRQLNSTMIRANVDEPFRMESLAERLEMKSKRIDMESMNGPIKFESYQSIRFDGETIHIDGSDIRMVNIQQNELNRNDMNNLDRSYPIAYQLCLCADGTLFATDPNGWCEADTSICPNH
ncbi:hypothetical protein RDWZM_010505 [Blomia tropicalis]|uniref:Zeta-sarcoglycan-like n=1 Tax=Blomia tropicalis TaxID=40697 RepID=A0A9Q0M203_BLOTA|nr:hypothetical protein RDWZM_010505 [Blomia tropicalis]